MARRRVPRWYDGIALLFNLAGRGTPITQLVVLDDAEAIASDWQAVGDDLRSALAAVNTTQRV